MALIKRYYVSRYTRLVVQKSNAGQLNKFLDIRHWSHSGQIQPIKGKKGLSSELIKFRNDDKIPMKSRLPVLCTGLEKAAAQVKRYAFDSISSKDYFVCPSLASFFSESNGLCIQLYSSNNNGCQKLWSKLLSAWRVLCKMGFSSVMFIPSLLHYKKEHFFTSVVDP